MRSETGCKNCSSASTQLLTVWLQLPTHSVGDCFIRLRPEDLGKSWFHKRAYRQDENVAASVLRSCGAEHISKEFVNAYTLLSPWKKKKKITKLQKRSYCVSIGKYSRSKDSSMSSKDTHKKKVAGSFQAQTKAAKTRGGSIFF